MRSNPSMKPVFKVKNNIQPKLFCAGSQRSCSQVLLDLEYVRISGSKLCRKYLLLCMCCGTVTVCFNFSESKAERIFTFLYELYVLHCYGIDY